MHGDWTVWDKANLGSQARYPSLEFVRFVARRYFGSSRSGVRFLDIGSGRHAPNTRFLEDHGFTVTAIDSSAIALAHIRADVRDVDIPEESFDCVLDHNTLCHIENPPMGKIRQWLKPGGMFFSVLPANDTWRGHLEGKGFVRCASYDDVLSLYGCFSDIRVRKSSYPDGDRDITSWIVEARK